MGRRTFRVYACKEPAVLLTLPCCFAFYRWVKDNQGQMIITAGQIVWTHECERALSDGDNARKSVKLLKKKWISYLNKLVAITRSKLNKIERNKVQGEAGARQGRAGQGRQGRGATRCRGSSG